MALFPLISLPTIEGDSGALPLFREVAWDLKNNCPIWRGGEPVYVTGAAAVLVWAWNALHTEKNMSDVFTRDYGLGIRSGLMGKPYTTQVKQSEAIRYVRDCLLINPYIKAVDSISVDMEGSELSISCRIQTVYGEVRVDGCKL